MSVNSTAEIVSPMVDMYDMLPERYSDRTAEYMSSDLSSIVTKLDKWRDIFIDIGESMSNEELEEIFKCFSKFIHDDTEPNQLEERSIILLFYLLDGCWADWQVTNPMDFLSRSIKTLQRTSRIKELFPESFDRIESSVNKTLRGFLVKSLLNHDSILTIVGNEKIQFVDESIIFFQRLPWGLSELFNCYVNQPLRCVDILKLELNISYNEREGFRTAWYKLIEISWLDIRLRFLESWKCLFDDSTFEYGSRDPEDFLLALPPAFFDKDWFDWCIHEFIRRSHTSGTFGRIKSRTWKHIIRKFRCWTDTSSIQFLECLDEIGQSPPFDIVHQMLLESPELSASKRVSITLFFLMKKHNEIGIRPSKYETEEFDAQKEKIGGLAHEETVLWIYARLKELPNWHSDHRSIWCEFGPHEKAAWRAEIVEYVNYQPDVQHGLIEFLLWQTKANRSHDHLYSDMELLVLTFCHGSGKDVQYIESLQSHPSRLVQVRSRTLLARLGQISEPDPFTSLPCDGITASAAYQALSLVAVGEYPPSRTWMQNSTLERTIYDRVRRVERKFCEEYKMEWWNDEEVLLSSFLTRVEDSLADVNEAFRALASQGIGVTPEIDFSLRKIPKREEGGPGIGSKRFSTDVAFIIRVRKAKKFIIHRATLVQCKKLKKAKNPDIGKWRPSFDIDRNQCNDLINQTESSFYMFLIPTIPAQEVWITPAKLVGNLIDIHRREGTLPCISTYHASRPFAHWLTYHLFGLWTGDERKVVVEKAEGTKPGISARLVVTVSINLNPTDDDGVSRKQ